MASTTARRAPTRRRKSSSRSRSSRSTSGGLTSWVAVLAIVVGGIAIYDNRAEVWQTVSPYLSADGKPETVRAAEKPKPEKPVAQRQQATGAKAQPLPPEPVPVAARAPLPAAKPVPQQNIGEAADGARQTGTIGENFSGRFYFCGTSGLDTCVVGGDTFWYHKTKVTLADVVAPRTEDAACQQERDRGFAAKVRLRDLLNSGRFDLQVLRGQVAEGAGAVSRIVTLNGRSLGSILVSEGLAHPRMGRRQAWCP